MARPSSSRIRRASARRDGGRPGVVPYPTPPACGFQTLARALRNALADSEKRRVLICARDSRSCRVRAIPTMHATNFWAGPTKLPTREVMEELPAPSRRQRRPDSAHANDHACFGRHYRGTFPGNKNWGSDFVSSGRVAERAGVLRQEGRSTTAGQSRHRTAYYSA
jgi:hypothetical protein